MKKVISLFIDKSFYRFVLVGIINTVIGTSIMFVMYNCFNQNFWMSSSMNYIVGSLISFFLNKFYTFEYKSNSITVFLKFIINIMLCYMVSYGITKYIVSVTLTQFSDRIRDNIAMFAGMCLFVISNYLTQRFVIFKKQ